MLNHVLKVIVKGRSVMELDYIKLGKRVKAARVEKGFTQEKLSVITGITQAHIGNIETGRTKVGLPTLVKIANALDTTVDPFLYDSLPALIDRYDKDFRDALDGCSEEDKEHLLEILKLQIKYLAK